MAYLLQKWCKCLSDSYARKVGLADIVRINGQFSGTFHGARTNAIESLVVFDVTSPVK